MSWTAGAILALCVGFPLAVEVLSWRKVRRLGQRGCMGRAWRRRFPRASSDDIRGFLKLVVDSLGLPWKCRLSLSPDDRVLDLYGALYPLEGLPDAMELETLADGLEYQYGMDVSSRYAAMTLGELFDEANRAACRLTR